MMITNQCDYCFDEKMVTADKRQWVIHLAGHRPDIIHSLSQVSSHCILYPCAASFANQIQARSHYRYDHKRSDIIEWAFSQIPPVFVRQFANDDGNIL